MESLICIKDYVTHQEIARMQLPIIPRKDESIIINKVSYCIQKIIHFADIIPGLNHYFVVVLLVSKDDYVVSPPKPPKKTHTS